MLTDFLAQCNNVIPDESRDFQAFLSELSELQICIGFMPAIGYDLYPVYALTCTDGRNIISPNVYILPTASRDNWAGEYFEGIINRFYEDKELNENYSLELDEMILLHSENTGYTYTLYDGTEYNVVLCRIKLPTGRNVYLILISEAPEDCWQKIIEAYSIKCDILIDSNRGLEDYYYCSALYPVMRETDNDELLPKFYFNGLYEKSEPPKGFKHVYTIQDTVLSNGGSGTPIIEYFKRIYNIDWTENRNS